MQERVARRGAGGSLGRFWEALGGHIFSAFGEVFGEAPENTEKQMACILQGRQDAGLWGVSGGAGEYQAFDMSYP